MTLSEVIICKMYLEDLDQNKSSNEYKLMMGLLEEEEKKAEEKFENTAGSFAERLRGKVI